MSPCGHPDYTFSTLQSLDTCLKSHLTGQRRPEQAFQLPNAPGPNGPAARQARTRAPREARDPCNEFVSHHTTPRHAKARTADGPHPDPHRRDWSWHAQTVGSWELVLSASAGPLTTLPRLHFQVPQRTRRRAAIGIGPQVWFLGNRG